MISINMARAIYLTPITIFAIVMATLLYAKVGSICDIYMSESLYFIINVWYATIVMELLTKPKIFVGEYFHHFIFLGAVMQFIDKIGSRCPAFAVLGLTLGLIDFSDVHVYVMTALRDLCPVGD